MSQLDELIKEELASQEQDELVAENDDGTKTVTLDVPITVGGKEVASVTFRKAKGRDMLETDKDSGDLAKAFRLASVLGDIPFSAMASMEAEDALRCSRVAGTMGKKSRTGGKR